MWDQRPVKHGPGITAPDSPSVVQVFRRDGIQIQHYTLKPTYKIEATSRVIAQRTYWFDDKNQLSPFDFVLGWGDMSDERILSQVQTPINERDFKVEVIRPPLTFNEIRDQILYMHAIPANEEVKSKLAKVREGHIVSLSGYIVDINDRADLFWKSSFSKQNSRLDHNQIVYVEEINVL
ncbi:MAG: hypothetical protein R3283_10505 [Balneolaceae bacterium]|nr:hypothetical protein [Balneolaceae bacterium]